MGIGEHREWTFRDVVAAAGRGRFGRSGRGRNFEDWLKDGKGLWQDDGTHGRIA